MSGRLGGSLVERLPLAQVVILGSWDRVPHRAPCGEPASLSAYVSASVCKVTQLRMTPKAQNGMAPARTPMPLPLGTDAVAPSDDVGH